MKKRTNQVNGALHTVCNGNGKTMSRRKHLAGGNDDGDGDDDDSDKDTYYSYILQQLLTVEHRPIKSNVLVLQSARHQLKMAS